jgi:hypothetical protein
MAFVIPIFETRRDSVETVLDDNAILESLVSSNALSTHRASVKEGERPVFRPGGFGPCDTGSAVHGTDRAVRPSDRR